MAVLVGSVDRGLDALLEIGDQVARIAAEYLIAALPTEHDLHVLAGKLRNHVLRKRARAGNRNIQMPDDVVNVIAKVGSRDVHQMKGGAGLPRCQRGISGLVVAGIVGETAMKRQPVLLVHLGRQNGDQARIDSAGNIGSTGTSARR